MRRAKLPLNPDAVRAADQALFNNHPELNGRKLTMGPEDGELRKEWMDSYLAAGGGTASPTPSTPPASPTVPCPQPPPAYTLPSNIGINGTPEFQAQVRRDLMEIAGTPTGRAMLDSIERSGKPVTISETSRGNGASPVDGSRAVRNAAGTPGPGTGSNISYNPNRTQVGDGSEPWMTRPAPIGLAHELMHAEHSANGTNDFSRAGEEMVVGNPPYDSQPYSENKVRSEWHPQQPARTEY